MSSHSDRIAMLGKPLTDEEAEQLMSRRIDAKWVEALAEEWRDMQRAKAGDIRESTKIATMLRRKE